MALWLGYNAGIVSLLRLHPNRRRPHEVAMLAADHLLYGLVIGRLGGRIDRQGAMPEDFGDGRAGHGPLRADRRWQRHLADLGTHLLGGGYPR